MDVKQKLHQENVCSKILSIKKSIPTDFELHQICVGNIEYVGFSERETNKLICITSEKSSVINLDTLEVVFCDVDYDEISLTATCEELDFEALSIAGITGGGLRTATKRGELLSVTYPEYPMCKIIYNSNYNHYLLKPELATCVYEDYDIKALGFSRCNNFFVIAATDLAIFKRV